MAPTEQQLKQNKARELAGLKKLPKARVQRYIKNVVEASLVEKYKSTLLLQGIACNNTMMILLKELKSILSPHSKLLSKKNNIIPFDSSDINGGGKGQHGHQQQHSIEFLCTKNDCTLFGIGTHNKKRPNNFIMGRLYNHIVLDQVELGILYFKSMNQYGGSIPKKRIGSKPLLLFVGDLWSYETKYTQLQNLFIDFYRGENVDKIMAAGIDHIITFTITTNPLLVQSQQQSSGATPTSSSSNSTTGNGNINTDPIIHQRTYFIKLKKSTSNPNTNVPEPLLIPCGPDMDYIVRRTSFADSTTAMEARKQPNQTGGTMKIKSVNKEKKKNTSTNLFGETIGKLHISKQIIDGTQTGKKVKALKRAEKNNHDMEQMEIEKELQAEEME